MFGQTFQYQDLAIIGLLIVLEGVLSLDNALVLGLLARRLPKHLQSKALTYGLVGAFVFRLIAIATAALLLKWLVAKLIGGLYLIYVAGKYFLVEMNDSKPDKIVLGPDGQPTLQPEPSPEEADREIASRAAVNAARVAGFWATVLVIELTDIAFAVDSILAAVALVAGHASTTGPHPKLWVVFVGGMLGVILMRFAAVVFIRLLERFPRFELSAYLLVMVIGMKLVVDWAFNRNPHQPVLNFHSPASPVFWIFWGLMLLCFAFGFTQARPAPAQARAGD